MKAHKQSIIAFVIATSAFLTSCQGNPMKRFKDKQQEQEEMSKKIQIQGFSIDELNTSIKELQKKIQEFQTKNTVNERLDGLEEKMDDSEKSSLRLLQLLLAKEKKSIVINLKSNEQFQKIETSLGFFFIAPERIEKASDDSSYSISLSFGNPFLCNFDNAKFKLSWTNGEGGKSEKEIDIPNPLKAGRWNRVDFILDSISDESLEKVEVTLDTPSVQLYQ